MLYIKFKDLLKEKNLIEVGDSLLLGVSGGVDSVVLLDLISRLKDEFALQIAVAHVNYGLRGADSDLDESFVKELAKKYGAAFFFKKAGSDFKGENLQLSARKIRFDFFKGIILSESIDRLMLAHHKDDQVETVLLHLVRGAGLHGLRGMELSTTGYASNGSKAGECLGTRHAAHFRSLPASLSSSNALSRAASRREAGKPLDKAFEEDTFSNAMNEEYEFEIVRPMLPFSREEILEYARDRKLDWREDRTNSSTDYSRNAIRHKVIPILKEINSAVDDAVFALSRAAQIDDDYIFSVAQSFADESFNCDENKLTFSRSAFLKLDRAVRARVIFIAYRLLKGDMVGLLSDHIEHVEGIAAPNSKGSSYDLPSNISVKVTGDDVVFVRFS